MTSQFVVRNGSWRSVVPHLAIWRSVLCGRSGLFNCFKHFRWRNIFWLMVGLNCLYLFNVQMLIPK